MPLSEDLLRIKASATLTALKALSAKQREQSVTKSMGEDFNKLREMVLEARPDLEPLLPAKLELIEGMTGDGFNERYQDLHAYCEQIVAFLQPPPGTYTPRRISRG